MNSKEHWAGIYKTKKPTEVSWYQPHLTKSLELITESGIDKKTRIIDVGGGASTLADDLLEKGYSELTVLDISQEALGKSKERLGDKANRITWVEADVLKIDFPENSFDLWHDRAVFHFLTKAEERKAYLEVLKKALKSGGFVIISSFSLEGPLKCSGLDVVRCSSETLSSELGNGFSLIKSSDERHKTPFNSFQNFVYVLFRKN
ncbi:MAG: methyltransferase [Omnitrophica bacterium RIFCSPLOWO2_01_FULL_45_10b]|nr:MAG: methyltransferase [Omnitrophica bacterium RIFCSPLOWO2_01_FULL_45_10b]